MRVERRRYWNLENVAAAGLSDPLKGSDEDLVSALEELLVDAVGRQMMADVPLGAFLSGGIDSSLVTALMVRANRGPIRTFSIGFDEDAFDESKHAAAIAAHLGTVHTPLTVTAQDALKAAPSIVDHYDEPFSDHSQIPTFLLARLTREHVTVALSGDGGDELFAGYNRYQLAGRKWAHVAAVPKSARALAARLMMLPAPQFYDALARLVPGSRNFQAGDKVAKLASILPFGVEEVFQRLVSVNPDADALVGCMGYPAFGGSPPDGLAPVARMQFADTLAYMPDDVLQKVDRATMAVSLEARPPLLDHRVVEFAWRLPERALIRGGETKWILRRVLERHVPRALFDRPKMGFGVPLADWLRGGLRDWGGDMLGSADYGGGIIDPTGPRRMWDEHQGGRRDHAYRLWPFLIYEAWRRRWVVDG